MKYKVITYLIIFFNIIVFNSCITESEKKDVFHGTVRHTYSELSINEFEPTSETWMKISIYKIEANVADGPSWTMLEKEFTSSIKLPYLYEIPEVNSEMFDFNEFQYFLQCKVYRGTEEDIFVGDLASEIITEITDLNISNDIEVFGIEDCASEIAGGFCTTQYRD